MILEKTLRGKYVYLRLADISDVVFTLKIRQDKTLNQFIHPVNNDLQKQIIWIENQRKKPNDYFFVAFDNNNLPCGTISIYNIIDDVAEIGRQVSCGNPIQTFEIANLCFDFAFFELKLSKLIAEVNINNTKIIKFAKLYNAIFKETFKNDMGLDAQHIEYTNENWKKTKVKIEKMIYRQ